MWCKFIWLCVMLKWITDADSHDDYAYYYYEETTEGTGSLWGQAEARDVSRCMRRFTPGYCLTPLRPVWAYVFHTYSCVERLGCRARYRFNRFDSRQSCELRCRDVLVPSRRRANRTTDAPSGHDEVHMRRMAISDEVKLEEYAREELAEVLDSQPVDGPLRTYGEPDGVTTETDIDALYEYY